MFFIENKDKLIVNSSFGRSVLSIFKEKNKEGEITYFWLNIDSELNTSYHLCFTKEEIKRLIKEIDETTN